MYEMAGERSIEKDAHAGDSEPGAIHVYQGDSFNKKEDASLPVESSERDVEVVWALDSQTNVEPSLSVEGSKENTAIGHTFASDASVEVEQGIWDYDHRQSRVLFYLYTITFEFETLMLIPLLLCIISCCYGV